MSIRLTAVSIAALVICAGQAAAETRSFPEHNFSIELPDGWSESNAPVPAPAIFTGKNTGGQKIFIAIAAQVPENERSSVVRSMAASAKKASKEKGWKISGEKQIAVSGLTFETFKSEMPDGTTVLNWMTSAGSEAYSLQGISKTGDASTDPELHSILASFHLLSAVPANTPGIEKDSVAYKAGRVFGCCLFPGAFIALLAGLIIWLVRRNKPKQ